MMHPIHEYIDDPKMIEIAKKPELFCEHYGIPVTRISDVSAEKTGRLTTFTHKGNPYKRVELVAKAHYEAQGLEVSWSEGVSILLIKVGIMGALARRIKDTFSMKSIDEYLPDKPTSLLDQGHYEVMSSSYEKLKSDFEQASVGCYTLMRNHLLITMTPTSVSPKNELESTTSEPELIESKSIVTQNSLFHKIHDLELVRLRQKMAFDEIKAHPPIVELIEHMNNYICEQQLRYSAPNQKYKLVNYNDWTIQFARRLIEVLGLEIFSVDNFLTVTDNPTIMSVSDLTILDPVAKVLRFVEVKNDDGFTPLQLFHLQEWLKMANEIRSPFELCLVQPT
jgi:hypothetical protein